MYKVASERAKKRTSTGRKPGRKKTGRTTAAKKNTRHVSRKEITDADRAAAKLPPERVREIYLFVYLAITLLLMLGSFGACGKVGEAVSGFFFGLFGVPFYILPVFFFIAAALLLVNGPRPRLVKKLIWLSVVFMICGFCFQFMDGAKDVTVSDLYSHGYEDHRGGGIIFGGILCLLYRFIGKTGSVVVATLLFIISVIEITGVSVLSLLKALVRLPFPPEVDEEDGRDDEDGDEYEYEDDVEDRRSRKSVKAEHYQVYDADGNTAADLARHKRKPKNPRVPQEEVHEVREPREGRKVTSGHVILPAPRKEEKELRPENADAAPFRLQPEEKSGLSEDTPVQEAAPEEETGAPVELSPEEERILGIGNPLASVKHAPHFDLKPDAETYADPLGDDAGYDAEKGSVTGTKENGGTEAGVRETRHPRGQVTRENREEETEKIENTIQQTAEEPPRKYSMPPVSLLKTEGKTGMLKDQEHVTETAIKLKKTLESFGVNVTITNCSIGPTVTRYELQPEQGVKVSRIVNLQDDIKLNLAAADIRIEAPIPGKAAVGIEVPNKKSTIVYFRDLIDNDAFRRSKADVAFAVGKDISGQIIITDIAKMPHLLIAGATGSGKSVCINSIIMSILYKYGPEDVRLIMIDPKMVELSAYNGIPHLLIPVVTDPKKAAGALNWAVNEMTKRYELFSRYNVRNIRGFNEKVARGKKTEEEEKDPGFRHMPQLIVIVDELADLMLVAHGEVEDSIERLSQLARAAGIHLVIATQRPSVDVITGVIKANIPARIAFAVSSGVDSRTILDSVGAEKLLGKGDMLFYTPGFKNAVRVQGAFISDEEVIQVVDYIREHNGETGYDDAVSESIDESVQSGSLRSAGGGSEERYDEYFEDAGNLIIEKDKASIGSLQRAFRIGFNRASRIMDQLAEAGVVGPEEGTKPRKILMTKDQFQAMLDGEDASTD